jgi:hypothetical protein
MAGTEFVVEGAFEAGGRAYVVARLLGPSVQFDVTSSSTLGGSRVERWLEMPRGLDVSGAQRTDLFGFCLRSIDDLTKIHVGDQVELVW